MDLSSWTPEYFATNESLCLEQLSKPEIRSQIPLLNCTPLHEVVDNALVRFRGMIQDMQDPECYLERYDVRKKDDGSLIRVQSGKYRDVLAMNKDEETVDFQAGSNKYGERRSMFVISIPGYNYWAVECEEKMNPTSRLKSEGQVSERSSTKRCHGEDSEMMETDESGEGESVFKKPMLPVEQSTTVQQPCSSKTTLNSGKGSKFLSAEYLLNSPIPDRPSKASLVKLYSNYDDCSLNSLVDVVGFLSVDPALDGSTDQVEEFEDEMSEHQATNPPPSLIPRIHAISFQELRHLNPLLEPYCESTSSPEANDIWKDIQNLLTQCLFEDKVAADYLLCHLISTVYVRNEIESLGHFSLNLSNIPSEVLPDYTKGLYEIMELLLPASHYFPMTLENMNTMQFVPKKDYTTNKLTSGLLQLAPHTHLLLDETKLQTGKLESTGVEAVQSIAHLIKTQKLKYNFQFYQLEFNSDVPVLVLSEGKSMLPTNFCFPLVPDVDAIKMIGETLKAGKHFRAGSKSLFSDLVTILSLVTKKSLFASKSH